MAWTDSVVTIQGVKLLAELLDGDTLTITGAKISSKNVPSASLMAQTDIAEPIDVPVNISRKKRGDNSLSLFLQVQNTGLATAQTMRQVGIFAKTVSIPETLIAICQHNVGEEIPPETESPKFLLEFQANFAISNDGEITITSNPSTVIVTQETLDMTLADYADRQEVKGLIPTTLPANGGNADTVNGHTVNADVPANAKFTDTKYTAATVAPKANGTAAVGTSAKYAREDHVHPLQTSVSGNAGTATKLKTARNINGIPFDGTEDITIPLGSSDLSNKMDKENPVGTGTFSFNGEATADCAVSMGTRCESTGTYSFSEGIFSIASGDASHAECYECKAEGSYSHAEGYKTTAVETSAHAEGYGTTAEGSRSHAEGNGTAATNFGAHAEGSYTGASGTSSHAEGEETTAEGDSSHAEGRLSKAIGEVSHAEGDGTSANGDYSHAEGKDTDASGIRSHAEGSCTLAYGNYSHAEGYSTVTRPNTIGTHAEGGYCIAAANRSHAQGWYTKAEHECSFAAGSKTLTGRACDTVLGILNVPKTDSALTIGWGHGSTLEISESPKEVDYNEYQRRGSDVELKNIFRVDTSGTTYGLKAYTTSGADYAEYIKPWFDDNAENEDRRGYFVTIKDGKLYKAEPEDYIVGITSGNPSVVGNGDEDWLGRWQRDEFNELIYKDVEVDDYEEHEDENGKLISVKVGSHTEKQTVQNPDYDPLKEYIERKDRPEWSAVGMVGVLPLRDDGTCVSGGFAKCGAGGIATKADSWECRKTFFVIERINDHIISVEMR